jgi:hypothetical protein
MGVALNKYPNRIDNNMRRLDQSLIHINGVIYSYVLSQRNSIYTIINSIFNVISIYKIWLPKYSNDGKRWKEVRKSIILYLIPLLIRGDIFNFGLSLLYITLGGICFHPAINFTILNGWGHSIFHLYLGKFVIVLCNSVIRR